jgi:hypothetical protein
MEAAMLKHDVTIDQWGEPADYAAHDAEMILPNMRGACVTVDGKVHALFHLDAVPHSGATRRAPQTADAAKPA